MTNLDSPANMLREKPGKTLKKRFIDIRTSDWKMLTVDTFVTENDPGPGRHSVQWQFTGFMITCVALDLSFARELTAFVAETRANPAYRDIPLGKGLYRYMPEKSIDLSHHFLNLEFKVWKLGEWDHGYLVRISPGSHLSISVELHQKGLDDFLYGLAKFIDI